MLVSKNCASTIAPASSWRFLLSGPSLGRKASRSFPCRGTACRAPACPDVSHRLAPSHEMEDASPGPYLSVSPLESALTARSATVDSNRLAAYLSPLDATLTKNRGGRMPQTAKCTATACRAHSNARNSNIFMGLLHGSLDTGG
jgi:hypothetical protein